MEFPICPCEGMFAQNHAGSVKNDSKTYKILSNIKNYTQN